MTARERDLDRAAHPAPAAYNNDGTRRYTPPPQPEDIRRNFGAPYIEPTEEEQ